MRRRLLECALVILALILPVQPLMAASYSVSQAWLRSLPGGLPAAGYFTLKNNGDKPLVFIGAASADCGMIMLHKSSTQSGMARMEDVVSVTVAAKREVAFKPGGYHLMCMDPKAGLKKGDIAKVTLKFEGRSQMEVDFHVTDVRGHW